MQQQALLESVYDVSLAALDHFSRTRVQSPTYYLEIADFQQYLTDNLSLSIFMCSGSGTRTVRGTSRSNSISMDTTQCLYTRMMVFAAEGTKYRCMHSSSNKTGTYTLVPQHVVMWCVESHFGRFPFHGGTVGWLSRSTPACNSLYLASS